MRRSASLLFRCLLVYFCTLLVERRQCNILLCDCSYSILSIYLEISISISENNSVDIKYNNLGWNEFIFNSQLLLDNNTIEKYLSKNDISNDMVVIISNVSLCKNSCLPCFRKKYNYDILLIIKPNKLYYHLMYPISERYELFDATEYIQSVL